MMLDQDVVADGEIRESMTEKDVEIVVQRAREGHRDAALRAISDNGPRASAPTPGSAAQECGLTV